MLALALVLFGAAAYVMPHGVLDLGRLVTAIPIGAFVFLLLAMGVRLVFGARVAVAASPYRPVWSRGNPAFGMVLGLVGLAVAGAMGASADSDMRAYRAAPSCRSGFAGVPEAGGPCRLVAARIIGAYFTGRHSSTETLGLRFEDGSTRRVDIGHRVNGNLWEAARNGTALDATAQFDGTSIVALQTAAGQIETSDFPQERLTLWTLFGLFAGFVGLMAAITTLVRGTF